MSFLVHAIRDKRRRPRRDTHFISFPGSISVSLSLSLAGWPRGSIPEQNMLCDVYVRARDREQNKKANTTQQQPPNGRVLSKPTEATTSGRRRWRFMTSHVLHTLVELVPGPHISASAPDSNAGLSVVAELHPVLCSRSHQRSQLGDLVVSRQHTLFASPPFRAGRTNQLINNGVW